MKNVDILACMASVIARNSKQSGARPSHVRYHEDGLVTIRLLDDGELHIQDNRTGEQWMKGADVDTSKLSQACLDNIQIKYLTILGVSAEHVELCAASLKTETVESDAALRLARNMIIEHRALNLAP